MLPPVPATSVSQAMQANQRQTATQQVASETAAPDATIPVTFKKAATGPTSSMEILGLSGQMRLAQSLSVFAETLGSLLKLPRREGEALADYSKRLAATINALGGEERARLQAQLNQIIQGATLRLLTELLKDPSGPAAARLAVQIEIAQYQEQYQERDLAARYAVSSYRQNNGNDQPSPAANTNANSAMDENRGPAIHDGADTPARAKQDGPSDILGGAAQKNDAPPTKAAADSNPGTAALLSRTEAASAAKISEQGAADTHIADTNPATSHEVGTDDGAEAGHTSTGRPAADGKATAPQHRPHPPQAQNETTSTVITPDPQVSSKDSEPAPKPARIYDAAALVRQAHGEHEIPSSIARTITDGFHANWITGLVADETENRGARQMLPAHGNITLHPGGEEMETPTESESSIGKQASVSMKADDEVPGLPAGPLSQTNAALSTSAMIAAQSDTAFEKALLGMTFLPREVPAHPLVPHAGTPEFDDTKEHEIRRKAPVGDDEQPPQREHRGRQQSSGGNEQQSSSEEQSAAPAPASEEAVCSDLPETFSTTDAGLRQAPRQHLSDRPAPSAEDFYRRLAALE